MSTTIVVTKNDKGELEGVGSKCKQALHRFNRWVARLEPGEIFTMEVWKPRNPKFHRLHFWMLAQLYDAQERFVDPEHLRAWLQIGAGYCDMLPGPAKADTPLVAVPKSIAYSKMDDLEFAEMHAAVKDFMRSTRATRYLWPDMDDFRASEIVEGIIAEAERDHGR